ncbi:uncharacterized protein N7483_008837 [Penicillium malachiteum]|uniref:uncharacterized protein n=1 Tax=Penicillium malachiteum TaxID=1324776 RepID=UPI0025487525|nr:uncharacterized protein N7483_008837 [Penicillium malachiteum]KAJ5720903.1 hypothetical protein N7483_008837 [Penicillium malachiteum]
MYINIFFGPMDRHLNDAHIVRNIQSRIESRQGTITLWPEQAGQPNVFSIQVSGTDQKAMWNEALSQATVFIRNQPTLGLPFKRAEVF